LRIRLAGEFLSQLRFHIIGSFKLSLSST
jgi:hypothetical protein